MGSTALHVAASQGDIETINSLLTDGNTNTDVNADDNYDTLWKPIHWAAEKGKVDAINALVALGADVNAKNIGGQTPLHRAAWNGHVDAIKALVLHGAAINARDKTGWTPLFMTTTAGSQPRRSLALRCLIALGADATARDESQQPLFTWASWQGADVQILHFLAQHGASVNARDKRAWTPLHYAAGTRKIATVTMFLDEFDADASTCDTFGYCPLQRAGDLRKNGPEVHAILAAGAAVKFTV